MPKTDPRTQKHTSFVLEQFLADTSYSTDDPHSILNFPEHEGYSRKLKKLQGNTIIFIIF